MYSSYLESFEADHKNEYREEYDYRTEEEGESSKGKVTSVFPSETFEVSIIMIHLHQ